MRYWRPWTAFALGWWLGRLLGLIAASWRLTRWLRRAQREGGLVSVPVDDEEAKRG